MSARPSPDLPDELRSEMARLLCSGIPLLPLGGGPDGKRPVSGKWATTNLTLRQILGPMYSTGVAMYGVRLDQLMVFDCDLKDQTVVDELEARFGPSPVHVQTPRGVHLYYRKPENSEVPKLRSEGLLVDVKTGPASYVAGPLSIRPDGGVYVPSKGVLSLEGLPHPKLSIRLPAAHHKDSARISKGERHNELVRFAVQRAAFVSSQWQLFTALCDLRDERCAIPDTIPDKEVEAIASWAWELRLENRLFEGRRSAFPLHRRALDLLRGLPAQEDALALYARLLDAHGHIPGRSFPLCWKSMRDAGLISLSRDRFLAARRTLQRVGLLKQAGKHLAGARKKTFMLAMPLSDVPGDEAETGLG